MQKPIVTSKSVMSALVNSIKRNSTINNLLLKIIGIAKSILDHSDLLSQFKQGVLVSGMDDIKKTFYIALNNGELEIAIDERCIRYLKLEVSPKNLIDYNILLIDLPNLPKIKFGYDNMVKWNKGLLSELGIEHKKLDASILEYSKLIEDEVN